METIGIPPALAYYFYFPYWKEVPEGLGKEVLACMFGNIKVIRFRGL